MNTLKIIIGISIVLVAVTILVVLILPLRQETTEECTLSFPSNASQLKVYLNPAYVQSTLNKQRFMPTQPFHLYQDIIVELSFCPQKGQETIPQLIITDASGTEKEILRGAFTRVEGKGNLYRWHLQGWPSGFVANEEKAKLLIESIAQGREIFIRVEQGQQRFQKAIEMTNCVQVYGRGPHSTVMMYSKGSDFHVIESKQDTSIFKVVNDTVENGFKKIDPFKSQLDYFSFYADLNPIDDALLPLAEERATTITGIEYDLPTISSCPEKEITFFHTGKSVAGGGAYTLPKAPWIVLTRRQDAAVYLHEYGHAFCGLTDEYIRYSSPDLETLSPLTNCARNASTFFSTGKTLYGEVAEKGCTFPHLYRSSSTSLMMDPRIEKLNIVSCGFCLAEIQGGKARDYWQACAALDTIKPDCQKSSQCPAELTCNAATGLCEG